MGVLRQTFYTYDEAVNPFLFKEGSDRSFMCIDIVFPEIGKDDTDLIFSWKGGGRLYGISSFLFQAEASEGMRSAEHQLSISADGKKIECTAKDKDIEVGAVGYLTVLVGS